MALSSPPPPFPVQNASYLEPCFTGNGLLTSSAVGELTSGSVFASYPFNGVSKKELIFRTLQVSQSLDCSLSGSNIFLPLNLTFQDGFIPSTTYTHSLEQIPLSATLTGSYEASLCTSLQNGPQP